MVSQVKQNALKAENATAEIAYAAFQTHYKCVYSKQIQAAGDDPDAACAEHWAKNLPNIKTLWIGLVKAVMVNTVQAQRAGLLPDFLAPAPLPGLGGAFTASPDDLTPAALGRRLAARLRGEAPPSTQDTPPGLAIGRCTGDE